MPRYKPVERNGLFIPVVLDEQIQPGTFEFALQHLVDEQLDLTPLDAKFRNLAGDIVQHFVAYHSAEAMGYEYKPTGSYVFHSSKPLTYLQRTIGSALWVINGTRRPRGGTDYTLRPSSFLKTPLMAKYRVSTRSDRESRADLRPADSTQ